MEQKDKQVEKIHNAIQELMRIYSLAYQSPSNVNWESILNELKAKFGNIENVEKMINDFKLLNSEMERITNNINNLRLLLDNLAENMGESIRLFLERYRTTLDWWVDNREIILKAFMLIMAKNISTRNHEQTNPK